MVRAGAEGLNVTGFEDGHLKSDLVIVCPSIMVILYKNFGRKIKHFQVKYFTSYRMSEVSI